MIQKLTRETETRLSITPEAMRMDLVKGIIKENDIVFGVFNEKTSPAGWAYEIIKGEQDLALISSTKRSTELKTAAIPCIEWEQAVALKQMFVRKG